MIKIEEFIQRCRNKKLLEEINAAYQDDEPDSDEDLRLSRMRQHHRQLVEGEWQASAD
jgi:hypothetical protein